MKIEVSFRAADEHALKYGEIRVDGIDVEPAAVVFDPHNELLTVTFVAECSGGDAAPLSDLSANRAGATHTKARDTERAAAFNQLPKSGTQRQRVLHFFVENYRKGGDGLTDKELSDVSAIYLYSAAPRRVELERGGWVIDSGRRRASEHGVPSIVWCLTEKARQQLDLPVIGQTTIDEVI